MTETATDLADLSRCLALLEDKEALRATPVRGWRTLDHEDWDGWIRHWADDAQPAFGSRGVLDGRRAIRDKVAGAEEPHAAMIHQFLNTHSEVNAGRATGVGVPRSVGIADKGKPGEVISTGGPCDREFRREPDGWKMGRTVLAASWRQGEDTTRAFE